MTTLIQLAPVALVKPYAQPLIKVLIPRLKESDSRISSNVLAALGELSVVSPDDMLSHVTQLMPLIIEAMQDQSSIAKREISVKVLSKLSSTTR